MTAAMLFDSGLPKTFWGHAYLAATHLRNRIPTVTRNESAFPKSPHELWNSKVPNIHYIRRWGCKCYVNIPKQLRSKVFPEKVRVGFLIDFTEEGSYLAFIPDLDIVVGPTVEISFDEDIPSHAESYFSELHLKDHLINVSDASKPKCVEDFQYLIGTQHIDDENGTKYEVTRVLNQNGYIVAFRSPILLSGKRNRYEDETPIHIEDIVRLTSSSQLNGGTNTKSVFGVSNSHIRDDTFSQYAPLTHTHPSELTSKKRKGASLSSKTDSYGISEYGDLLDPTVRTLNGPTNPRKTVRFDILSKRERMQRTPHNVKTMGKVASHVTTQTSNSSSKPRAYSTFRAFHAMVENNDFDIDFVPSTYKQAMQSTDSTRWQHAIDKELKSISDYKVFSVVDKPAGIKLQTGRFLFKVKYTGQGTIYKARLIAHGFKQVAGSDYWETYAPVSSSISTRVFLAMCATYGMTIHQMDIDTAFLIADLVEDIYMDPPVGMNVPLGKVLKLHKCLYGLKQSPRYFNQHLVSTLLGMGFENFENEPCLFKKMIDGKMVLATIYVDDILIACSDDIIIQRVKDQLAATYKMKDMGEMDWYLGMRCKRNKKTGAFTLNQTKYIEDVIAKFDKWLALKRLALCLCNLIWYCQNGHMNTMTG